MVSLGASALVACAGNSDAANPIPTQANIANVPASALPSSTPSPLPSSTHPPTPTLVPTYTPQPSPTSTTTPTTIPTPTRDLYAGLRIEELIAREYGGGIVTIEETLERNPDFNRYLIKYPSDGLNIYGFLNVPQEGAKFPVVIVLHGFIPTDEYKVQDYTTRYADWLAEAGYMVFHPNYRNHPPSDNGEDRFRVGYATDVLNLLGIIREQSQDPAGTLRRADAGNVHLFGHSMGGGIAWRTTIVRPDWVKAVLFYGAMNVDEQLNYDKIAEWTDGRAGNFERGTPKSELDLISPSQFLHRAVFTPISIHHGTADGTVPVQWSTDICEQLETMQFTVECFTYRGQPHTFYGVNEDLFMERVINFFRAH